MKQGILPGTPAHSRYDVVIVGGAMYGSSVAGNPNRKDESCFDGATRLDGWQRSAGERGEAFDEKAII